MKNNINGWLNVYKPKGVFSTRVVSIIKRCYNAKKVGHAGTLDPFAEGVLPIALGEATKTVQFCMNNQKEYDFKIKWGESTSTYDSEGSVVEKSSKVPTSLEIMSNLCFFTGKIEQIPPKYSAIKINGKRAYDLARKGVDLSMKKRDVDIQRFTYKNHGELFSVVCSKGTYIRSLGNDLAESLGAKGHLTYLKRTKVGSFCAKESILLDMFKDPVYKDSLEDYLLPVDSVLDDIPVLNVDRHEAKNLRFGQKISRFEGESCGIMIAKNFDELVAIVSFENGVIKPTRVFNII